MQDNWASINQEQEYSVFLNEIYDSDFPNNPIYKLQTLPYYVENGQLFLFESWESSIENSVNFETPDYYETFVEFLNYNFNIPTISANYIQFDNNISNVIIYEGFPLELNVESFEQFTLNDNQVIEVFDELIITGDEENRFILNLNTPFIGNNIIVHESGSLNFSFVNIDYIFIPFKIYRFNSAEENKIIFTNVLFKNTNIITHHALDYIIYDENIGEFNILYENCTFIKSGYRFLFNDVDEMLDKIFITFKNNIFINSNIEPINSHDDYCYNLYSNTNYENLNQCENGIGIIEEDPLLNIDFTLQSESPCINTGDPNSYFDPDGTISDIGAYYYHQTEGDVNLDGEFNVIDIYLLVSYILENEEFNYNQLRIADMNSDNEINVIDVLVLIDLLLGNDPIVNNSITTYLSGIIEAIEDEQRYKYNIDMLNEQDVYILHFELQFDNKIPLNAIKGIRSDEMSVNYNIIADEYKINIMIFSPGGRKITPGYGTILEIELESTGLGRDGDLTGGSEFIITDLANNPEELIPVEIVSADELSRLADEKLNNLIPTKFALHPVFPNPFNPIARIHYDLPKKTHVSIRVFDLNGRSRETLVNRNQSPGMYILEWNAEHLSSGAYFIKMKTESYTKTQKVMLVK